METNIKKIFNVCLTESEVLKLGNLLHNHVEDYSMGKDLQVFYNALEQEVEKLVEEING